MLHILNGQSTEVTLRQSTVAGDYFSFRDVLITGPTPLGFEIDTWQKTRANHLSQSYDLDNKECEQELQAQAAVLASFKNYDEVVMWFEHDLFCQLNLLYVLNWFSNVDLGKTKLSLINIGEFPGRENFRGLGELNAVELSALFPLRESVSESKLRVARLAWEAFCSPDPTEIEGLIQKDIAEMPFLATAFRAHVRRFPTTKNGLGQIQNKCLQLIAHGYDRFDNLFSEFQITESVYGLGDAQLWLALQQMTNASFPIVVRENGVPGSDKMSPKTVFKLTETGEAILHCEADFVKLNEIDEWLGGVHLLGSGQTWRWDEQASRLQFC